MAAYHKTEDVKDMRDRRGSYFSPGEIVAYNRSGEVHFGVLEDIKIYDKVISWDNSTHEIRYRKVRAIVLGEDGKRSLVKNYNSIVVLKDIPHYLLDKVNII